MRIEIINTHRLDARRSFKEYDGHAAVTHSTKFPRIILTLARNDIAVHNQNCISAFMTIKEAEDLTRQLLEQIAAAKIIELAQPPLPGYRVIK